MRVNNFNCSYVLVIKTREERERSREHNDDNEDNLPARPINSSSSSVWSAREWTLLLSFSARFFFFCSIEQTHRTDGQCLPWRKEGGQQTYRHRRRDDRVIIDTHIHTYRAHDCTRATACIRRRLSRERRERKKEVKYRFVFLAQCYFYHWPLMANEFFIIISDLIDRQKNLKKQKCQWSSKNCKQPLCSRRWPPLMKKENWERYIECWKRPLLLHRSIALLVRHSGRSRAESQMRTDNGIVVSRWLFSCEDQRLIGIR